MDATGYCVKCKKKNVKMESPKLVSMKGKGKVSLVMQGRLIDMESVTEGEEIRPGLKVKVKSLSGTQLVVEKVDN